MSRVQSLLRFPQAKEDPTSNIGMSFDGLGAFKSRDDAEKATGTHPTTPSNQSKYGQALGNSSKFVCC